MNDQEFKETLREAVRDIESAVFKVQDELRDAQGRRLPISTHNLLSEWETIIENIKKLRTCRMKTISVNEVQEASKLLANTERTDKINEILAINAKFSNVEAMKEWLVGCPSSVSDPIHKAFTDVVDEMKRIEVKKAEPVKPTKKPAKKKVNNPE